MSLLKIVTDRIRARDGAELFCRATHTGSDTWLIGVHGIGEHMDRHTHLTQLFSNRYNIFQYDVRGHGRSDGRRGYVDSFDTHYRDLEDVVLHLNSTYPNLRYMLFGHSMGALIAAGYVQGHSHVEPVPERLFLASPPIGLGGRGGAIVNFLPRTVFACLSKIPLSLAFGSTINRHYLSHEKEVAASLEADPLSLKRLNSKLLIGLVDASKSVFSRPIAAPCPLFGAIGSDERIVSCHAARRYFATHEDKADFRIIEGAYHELHQESAAYRDPYFAFLKQSLSRS